ncbi:MAG: hypothetical protein GY749_23985, partial [Desulfobacteraceae bacterium]|nr:hypothetical protein [Desulfobacteraceae bacterium]
MANSNVIEIRIDMDTREASANVRRFRNDTDESMRGSVRSVSDFNTSMAGAAKTVAGLAGAYVSFEAVTAAIAGAANAGMKLEDAAAKIQTALGISRAEAEEFARVARDAYGDALVGGIAESADAVVAAQQQMQNASRETLATASANSLLVQQQWGDDYNKSIQVSALLMEDFGLSSKQSWDWIVSGYQKGLNASDDFLDSVLEYGSEYKVAGMSAEQMFSTLKTGFKVGVQGSDAISDALRELMNKLVDVNDEGSGFSTALGDIGISSGELAEKMRSGMTSSSDVMSMVIDKLKNIGEVNERNRIGAELLGTPYENLKGVILDLDIGKTVMADLAGASDTLRAQNETTRKSFQKFMFEIEKIGAEVWGSYGSIVREAADTATQFVSDHRDDIVGIFTNIQLLSLALTDGIGRGWIFVSQTYEEFAWNMRTSWENVTAFFMSAWVNVKSFFQEKLEDMRLLGIGLVDGLGEMWIKIEFTGKKAWAALSGKFRDELGEMGTDAIDFATKAVTALEKIPGMGKKAAEIKISLQGLRKHIDDLDGYEEALRKVRAEEAEALKGHRSKIDAMTEEGNTYTKIEEKRKKDIIAIEAERDANLRKLGTSEQLQSGMQTTIELHNKDIESIRKKITEKKEFADISQKTADAEKDSIEKIIQKVNEKNQQEQKALADTEKAAEERKKIHEQFEETYRKATMSEFEIAKAELDRQVLEWEKAGIEKERIQTVFDEKYFDLLEKETKKVEAEAKKAAEERKKIHEQFEETYRKATVSEFEIAKAELDRQVLEWEKAGIEKERIQTVFDEKYFDLLEKETKKVEAEEEKRFQNQLEFYGDLSKTSDTYYKLQTEQIKWQAEEWLDKDMSEVEVSEWKNKKLLELKKEHYADDIKKYEEAVKEKEEARKKEIESIKAQIQEELEERKKITDEILSLQKSITDSRKSTAEKMRELDRKSMSEMSLYEDKWQEVEELKQQAAAVSKTNMEESLRLYEEAKSLAAGLADEVREGEMTFVSEAEAIARVKQELTGIDTQTAAIKQGRIDYLEVAKKESEEHTRSLEESLGKASQSFDGTVEKLGGVFDVFVGDMQSMFAVMADGNTDTWTDMTGVFSQEWDQAAQGMARTGQMSFSGMFQGIRGMFEDLLGGLGGGFSGLWDSLKQGAGGIWDSLKGIFSGDSGGGGGILDSLWEGAKGIFSGDSDGGGILGSLWEGAKGIFSGETDIFGSIGGLWDDGVEWAGSLWDTGKEWVSDFGNIFSGSGTGGNWLSGVQSLLGGGSSPVPAAAVAEWGNYSAEYTNPGSSGGVMSLVSSIDSLSDVFKGDMSVQSLAGAGKDAYEAYQAAKGIYDAVQAGQGVGAALQGTGAGLGPWGLLVNAGIQTASNAPVETATMGSAFGSIYGLFKGDFMANLEGVARGIPLVGDWLGDFIGGGPPEITMADIGVARGAQPGQHDLTNEAGYLEVGYYGANPDYEQIYAASQAGLEAVVEQYNTALTELREGLDDGVREKFDKALSEKEISDLWFKENWGNTAEVQNIEEPLQQMIQEWAGFLQGNLNDAYIEAMEADFFESGFASKITDEKKKEIFDSIEMTDADGQPLDSMQQLTLKINAVSQLEQVFDDVNAWLGDMAGIEPDMPETGGESATAYSQYMDSLNKSIDARKETLEKLGFTETALTEIEAKRIPVLEKAEENFQKQFADARQTLIDNFSEEYGLTSVSEYDAAFGKLEKDLGDLETSLVKAGGDAEKAASQVKLLGQAAEHELSEKFASAREEILKKALDSAGMGMNSYQQSFSDLSEKFRLYEEEILKIGGTVSDTAVIHTAYGRAVSELSEKFADTRQEIMDEADLLAGISTTLSPLDQITSDVTARFGDLSQRLADAGGSSEMLAVLESKRLAAAIEQARNAVFSLDTGGVSSIFSSAVGNAASSFQERERLEKELNDTLLALARSSSEEQKEIYREQAGQVKESLDQMGVSDYSEIGNQISDQIKDALTQSIMDFSIAQVSQNIMDSVLGPFMDDLTEGFLTGGFDVGAMQSSIEKIQNLDISAMSGDIAELFTSLQTGQKIDFSGFAEKYSGLDTALGDMAGNSSTAMAAFQKGMSQASDSAANMALQTGSELDQAVQTVGLDQDVLSDFGNRIEDSLSASVGSIYIDPAILHNLTARVSNTLASAIQSMGNFSVSAGAIPSYQSGSLGITHDQIAEIHAGEGVIRKEHMPAVSAFLAETGLAAEYPGGGSGAVREIPSYASGYIGAAGPASSSPRVSAVLSGTDILVSQLKNISEEFGSLAQAVTHETGTIENARNMLEKGDSSENWQTQIDNAASALERYNAVQSDIASVSGDVSMSFSNLSGILTNTAGNSERWKAQLQALGLSMDEIRGMEALRTQLVYDNISAESQLDGTRQYNYQNDLNRIASLSSSWQDMFNGIDQMITKIEKNLDSVQEQIEFRQYTDAGGQQSGWIMEKIQALQSGGGATTLDGLNQMSTLISEWYNASVSETEAAWRNSQQQENTAEKFTEAGQTIEKASQGINQLVQTLDSTVKGVKYSKYNVFGSSEKYEEAEKDYTVLKEKASSGSQDDMKEYFSFINTYLEQAQSKYNSSDQYQEIYRQTLADIESMRGRAQSLGSETTVSGSVSSYSPPSEPAVSELTGGPDLSGINTTFQDFNSWISSALTKIQARKMTLDVNFEGLDTTSATAVELLNEAVENVGWGQTATSTMKFDSDTQPAISKLSPFEQALKDLEFIPDGTKWGAEATLKFIESAEIPAYTNFEQYMADLSLISDKAGGYDSTATLKFMEKAEIPAYTNFEQYMADLSLISDKAGGYDSTATLKFMESAEIPAYTNFEQYMADLSLISDKA